MKSIADEKYMFFEEFGEKGSHPFTPLLGF